MMAMRATKWLAKKISNYDDPNSLGSQLRRRRIAVLMKLIDKVFEEKGEVSLIDIGGTAQYWRLFPEDYLKRKHIRVTLVNIQVDFSRRVDLPCVVLINGDGCRLPFPDRAFDRAHSNSVIEHLGSWNAMEMFAQETRRIARYFYVQTPNFWFPIEPHAMFPFFHWLPVRFRKWLVMRYPLGHWRQAANPKEAGKIVESAILITKSQLRRLFPEATIITERFFGFAKSLIAVSLQ